MPQRRLTNDLYVKGRQSWRHPWGKTGSKSPGANGHNMVNLCYHPRAISPFYSPESPSSWRASLYRRGKVGWDIPSTRYALIVNNPLNLLFCSWFKNMIALRTSSSLACTNHFLWNSRGSIFPASYKAGCCNPFETSAYSSGSCLPACFMKETVMLSLLAGSHSPWFHLVPQPRT